MASTSTWTTRITKNGSLFHDLGETSSWKTVCTILLSFYTFLYWPWWNKIGSTNKEFYFFFWFKVAPVFKITTGQTDGSILFYFLDGDNRLAKVGKNCSPCKPATSVQFCNDIFIATDQMPCLWTIEVFSCKGRLAYIIAIIICWINHYRGLCM